MGTDLKDILQTKTEREAVEYLHSLYEAGQSSASIAKAMGVTDSAVRHWFKKYNFPTKQHGGLYKGKKIKITEEEYMTLSTKELMKKYNCSQFLIYQQTKHLPSKCGRKKKFLKKED